jgi:hypothetical protein
MRVVTKAQFYEMKWKSHSYWCCWIEIIMLYPGSNIHDVLVFGSPKGRFRAEWNTATPLKHFKPSNPPVAQIAYFVSNAHTHTRVCCNTWEKWPLFVLISNMFISFARNLICSNVIPAKQAWNAKRNYIPLLFVFPLWVGLCASDILICRNVSNEN